MEEETRHLAHQSGIYQILNETIESDAGQTGLFELPGPTGTGKTHAILSYIADQLIEHGPKCRRFVFTTDVKRNLPMGSLLHMLSERGHPELAELVIYLDSNADMLATNLDKAKEVMLRKPFEYLARGPRDPKSKKIATIDSAFDIFNLTELKRADDACKELIEAQALPSGNNRIRANAIEDAKKHLGQADKALRRKIASVLSSMCADDPRGARLMSTTEKRKLVERDEWWEWLRILYPSVLTFKKRVFFLSINKLLVQNSMIVEPTKTIWESELLDGSVVFIDEFELSKDVINSHLIEENVNRMTDAINLFRTIFNPLLEGNRTDAGANSGVKESGIVLTSRLFRSPKNNHSAGQQLRDNLRKVVQEAKKLYEALHLDRQFCLQDDLRYKNMPFLFNDFQSHVIASGKSWIAIRFLNSHNQIEMGSGEAPSGRGEQKAANPDIGDYYPAPLLLSRIEGIISWAVGQITRIAVNYMQVKEEDADKGICPTISFDQALATVLSELNIMDEVSGEPNPTKERIVSLCHEERARHIAANSNLKDDPTDLCLHQTGFRVHAFVESPNHDTLTRIERCGLPLTAERKLLELCRRNFVVAISASLDIPSILGNYDREYIQGMLADTYRTLSDKQRSLITHDYAQSISHYDNVTINVIKVNDRDENGEYNPSAWLEAFDDTRLAERVFNKLGIVLSDEKNNFYEQRILKICIAFRKFWAEDTARAMLCVLNKLPRAGDRTLDSAVLEDLFAAILESLGIKAEARSSYCVLGGGGNEFDRKKTAALSKLAEGNKLFVITTYKSAGAGQNLQYKIPEGIVPTKINDRPASDEMDFDCIYLEKPTHTSPSITEGKKLDYQEVLRHILGCEYLYENSEISRASLIGGIEEALKASRGRGVDYGYRHTKSALLFGAKQVYQAMGRLNRTNMKMPTIRIMADCRLLDGVPLDELRSCGVTFTPEFEALVNVFDEPSPMPNEEQKRLELRAVRASERSRTCINSKLGSGWRQEAQDSWVSLGDQVLKYPTLPNGVAVAPYMERNYYIEIPAETKSYRYSSVGDFREVEISFDGSRGDFVVSEKEARLDVLMKIPGMKRHFEQMGYATEWAPSRKIMTPVVAQSIYKGRLGEACGKHVLEECGIRVLPIEDPAKFEKFDFMLEGTAEESGAYIDFKHWKRPSDKIGWGTEQLLDWVFEKMERIDARRAIVANVLPPDGGSYHIQQHLRAGRKLLVVPALVKHDCTLDEQAIQSIRSFVNDAYHQ